MTYAIFRASGFQYRAEPGDVLRLPRMSDVDVGDTVTFDEVLLGATDGEVLVGRPVVKGAAVKAEVLAHDRADKVIVFKFKRRKNYRRKQGHRQDYTEIRVSEIDLGGGRTARAEEADEKKAKKAAKKKTAAKKEAEASADVVTEAAPEAPPKKKKKKAAPKKKAAKKKAASKPKAGAKKKTKAEAKKKSSTKSKTSKKKSKKKET